MRPPVPLHAIGVDLGPLVIERVLGTIGRHDAPRNRDDVDDDPCVVDGDADGGRRTAGLRPRLLGAEVVLGTERDFEG
jgi:hypothetical protein